MFFSETKKKGKKEADMGIKSRYKKTRQPRCL